MLHQNRDYVPVNVINAGIGGVCARTSVPRVQRDIISHHPDLAIVCFGLNDINEPLESYLTSLKTIFEQCLAAQIEVIFMTPNMLNTYVAKDTIDEYLDYAAVTAGYQTSGKMDQYMESA